VPTTFDQFMLEYWLFVEALLERAAMLAGVDVLNAQAASLGYPLGGALALTLSGLAAGLACLRAGRPGWGLVGLAVAEELSALALATAALSHGAAAAGIAAARLAAIALGVFLVSAALRRSIRTAREKAPAAPKTPPAW